MLISIELAYSNDFVHYQAIAGQKQNQPNCQDENVASRCPVFRLLFLLEPF
jgi:hypothetical protein